MNRTDYSVMLFAAGFGTRMRPLTDTMPKPLIKVAGRPLIDHAMTLVNEIEPKHIVANAHYHADQIEAYFAGTSVQVVREQDQILDTGGGLRAALPLLDNNPVITLNTDAVWAGPNPLSQLIEAFDPDHMDALLLCLDPSRVHGRKGGGDFALSDTGAISRKGPYTYAGAQILKTDLLQDIPDDVFSLNLVWDQMITNGRAFGTVYKGHWCDVGHPEGIKIAEDMLKDHAHD